MCASASDGERVLKVVERGLSRVIFQAKNVKGFASAGRTGLRRRQSWANETSNLRGVIVNNTISKFPVFSRHPQLRD